MGSLEFIAQRYDAFDPGVIANPAHEAISVQYPDTVTLDCAKDVLKHYKDATVTA